MNCSQFCLVIGLFISTCMICSSRFLRIILNQNHPRILRCPRTISQIYLQLYFISFVQGISESYLLCFQSPWRLVGVYCIGRRHGIRIDSVHVKSYCLCIKHLESGQALYIEKKDKRQQHSQLDFNWAIFPITQLLDI